MRVLRVLTWLVFISELVLNIFCSQYLSIMIIIIIMYIYHALINALRAHMIYVNLNMIFCTHVEHSPTKTIYVRHYTHTHTHTSKHAHDCSRNWVLILIGVEILWEEEGFQYGFKRWQSLAVSKVFWEWIPIPQQQKVQKPWVLRLCCWIFSVQVSSEGLWRSSVFLLLC